MTKRGRWMVLSIVVWLLPTLRSVALPPMLTIPTGVARLGALQGEADEAPIRKLQVPAFRLSRTEVSNADFAAFVTASGYTTHAEQAGWGWVWDGRWRQVKGADWRAARYAVALEVVVFVGDP